MNSDYFKEEIRFLEDKIGKAADRGQHCAKDVIQTYCQPYTKNELVFQAVCKYF